MFFKLVFVIVITPAFVKDWILEPVSDDVFVIVSVPVLCVIDDVFPPLYPLTERFPAPLVRLTFDEPVSIELENENVPDVTDALFIVDDTSLFCLNITGEVVLEKFTDEAALKSL